MIHNFLFAVSFLFVGSAEFASAKPPKWHIKHEFDADLSTSAIASSSPLVTTK